jgi:hypothetical protein
MFDWREDRFGAIILTGVTALILAVFALMGWAIHHEMTEPESGTVTELEYSPAHTTITCTTSGKVTTCTPITTSECYRVVYENGDEWGDACVAPNEFPLYQVGDQYPRRAR